MITTRFFNGFAFGLLCLALGCTSQSPALSQEADQLNLAADSASRQQGTKMETATFANGCFWCTEAVFEQVKGVQSVTSGYIGGSVKNPTYKQVCSGTTGHAEAVEIVFDPEVVTYAQLLEIFWQTHDPTTLNRQGPDYGTQYRSGVFYHNEAQKEQATFYKNKLDQSGIFDDPIVTEITAASTFYPAEDYHQEYFASNPNDRYCQINALPKVNKLKKLFADLVKEEAKR